MSTLPGEREGPQPGLVPLTIGVTGHRDLVEHEVPHIRRRVRALLESLQARFADRPLHILSPLAEGADQLVAEVALELNAEITAVLPMPRELYRADFEEPEARDRFDHLCEQAREVLELPVFKGLTIQQISAPGQHRTLQYAQVGVFLCAHSHILLALWDGKPSQEVGGTAQVVRFHHYDVMAGFVAEDEVNQQILADDESDLVYHIVVSRRRPDGSPRDGLAALDGLWLTTDEENPKSLELPDKYASIFERTSEFNRETSKHARRIMAQSYPLLTDDAAVELPASVHTINDVFCAADWLAIHYQRWYIRILKASHVLALVMAILFIVYTNVRASQVLMLAFGVCFAAAISMHVVAARGRWQGKYLEYRTLAEGLRVQFYWAAAGVKSASITKYTHDNFLQKQDIELAWIRNVMRVAGMRCDVAPIRAPKALAFVLDEWIGDEKTGGQLKYYRRKATEHLLRDARFARLRQAIQVLVFALLAVAVAVPSEDWQTALFVVLGVLLVAVSIREAFASRIAEKEVVRQYEFMHRIFRKAKARLASAASDSEKRRILRVLGEAALDEHAEWILLHRDRPLSTSHLWQMEG